MSAASLTQTIINSSDDEEHDDLHLRLNARSHVWRLFCSKLENLWPADQLSVWPVSPEGLLTPDVGRTRQERGRCCWRKGYCRWPIYFLCVRSKFLKHFLKCAAWNRCLCYRFYGSRWVVHVHAAKQKHVGLFLRFWLHPIIFLSEILPLILH